MFLSIKLTILSIPWTTKCTLQFNITEQKCIKTQMYAQHECTHEQSPSSDWDLTGQVWQIECEDKDCDGHLRQNTFLLLVLDGTDTRDFCLLVVLPYVP